MSNDEKMIRVRKRFLWWPMSAGLVGFRWLQTVWIRERFAPGPGAAYHEGHYGEWKAICFASPPIEVKACELALPERRYIVTCSPEATLEAIREKGDIPEVGSLLMCVSVNYALAQPGAWEVVCQYEDHDIPDSKETEPPVSRCENCIHFSEKTLTGVGTVWHEDLGTCHWHTPEPTWRDSRCSHFTPKGESDATSTQSA